MKWEREVIHELPIMSPYERYSKRETADGTCFFCQWVDACPPRDDALHGSLRCVVTLMPTITDECAFDDFDDFYDVAV